MAFDRESGGNQGGMMPTPCATGVAPAAEQLYDLINSAWLTQAIYVAAELRLAEQMRNGAKDSAALARATGTQQDAMRRLLRALCAAGLCESKGDDSFSITQAGGLLCEDAPQSLRGWALLWGTRLWPQWGTLLESVRTGESWRKRNHDEEGYGYLDRDPDAAASFYSAMRSVTRIVTRDAASLVDLSSARCVVDVGGGSGDFLAAVLRAWPALHGVCLDLPAAAVGAAQLFSVAGLDKRAEFLAGDFFTHIPAADVLLLKSVLHNWDDARFGRILANCRRSLRGGGRMLLAERVLPERMSDCGSDRSVVQADLNMLVGVGGRERTLQEYERLLRNAGFTLAALEPLHLGFSLLDCTASLHCQG